MRSRVDLPEPLGPTRPTRSWSWMAKLRPSNSGRASKALARSWQLSRTDMALLTGAPASRRRPKCNGRRPSVRTLGAVAGAPFDEGIEDGLAPGLAERAVLGHHHEAFRLGEQAREDVAVADLGARAEVAREGDQGDAGIRRPGRARDAAQLHQRREQADGMEHLGAEHGRPPAGRGWTRDGRPQ